MIETKFNSIPDLLQHFSTEQVCIEYLENLRWGGEVVSPFDETSKVYRCKDHLYRCKNTGKYFNAKTGTFLENTKISLRKWFLAVWLITSHKRGISSLQLARDLNVTQKTAWFMAQRIRACFGIENHNELNEGIVECDETFIGGKNKNRHWEKKVKNSQGRSFKDKVPVMGMYQRDGKINAFVVENTQRERIQPLIKKYIKTTIDKLITDEWSAYRGLSGYNHYIIDHSRKEYVSRTDKLIHTNNIEGAWTHLKKSLSGIYNWVSKKHLQKYVDEFVYRFNLRTTTDEEKFRYLLSHSMIRTRYIDLC